MLATGHPGIAMPDELRGDPRAVHAYEPHDYAANVCIVGAGLAAATEWLNALAAGASVVSVRRREPLRRPLNLPRPMFSKRGLARFHATGPEGRVEQLRRFSAPSFPPGRTWAEPVEQATRRGRFHIAAELNGAEQAIAATGFRRGYQHDRLLARLVDEHEVESHAGWIALAADSSVPDLTDETRTLSLAGVPAQWS